MWSKRVDETKIHPGLVFTIRLALRKLEKEGMPFKVYSGLRTFEQQNELYAIGRTRRMSDHIVTKAKGGQSMHNYGLAVDLAPLNLLTEDPDDLWWPKPSRKKGKIWFALEEAITDVSDANLLDIEWGGRWKFRDVPHCQIRTTLTELRAGEYPHCYDVEWLVKAHTTFLFETPWMTRRVQFLLNMQSYDVGPVDGAFGRRSTAALKRFQEDQFIDITSTVDEETVGHLVRLHQTAMSTPRGTLPEDLVG